MDANIRKFQEALKAALDIYQPGWDVRRHAAWDEHHPEEWNQNRRFKVWVDTLKRWVQGDHFPQTKKFEDFLDTIQFPAEVSATLLKLFHEVRLQRRVSGDHPLPDYETVSLPWRQTTAKALIPVAGQAPANPAQQFIGRQEKMHQLSAALADPNTRMVTLLGRNGIGKTALACRLLHELESGRWLHHHEAANLSGIVYLSPHTSDLNLEHLFLNCVALLEESVQQTLKTLWHSPARDEDKIDALIHELNGDHYLILLDNLEDLLDEDGQFNDAEIELFIKRCLRLAPNIKLLATSRIEPALPREIRHLNHILVLENGLPEAEGIRLLRNLDPNGTCGLRDAPEEQLRRTVQKVHGVPRALEVIAGILEDDRLARLDDILERFGALNDVREMIQEGFRRLDAQSKKIIETLAVLRRPVPRSAIMFVLEPFEPALELDSLLTRLVRTRMVMADREHGLVALQPIDADYAYVQLPENGSYSRRELERRAAAYYELQRTSPRSWQNINDLEPQFMAFEHYMNAGDYPKATQQIGNEGYQALFRWGHLQRIITLRQQLIGKLSDALAEQDNLYELALAFRALGQLSDATASFEQALAKAPENSPQLRDILAGLADVYRYQERYAEAAQLYLRSVNDTVHYNLAADVSARLGLGLIYHHLGDDKAAMEQIQTAIHQAKAEDNRKLEGYGLETLANIYRNWAHHNEALTVNEQALACALSTYDRQGEGNRLGMMGVIYGDLGQYDQALEFQQQALAVATQAGDLYGKSRRLVRLCGLSVDLAAYDLALEYGKEAHQIALKIGVRPIERCTLLYLARMDIALGQLNKARQKLEAARAIANETQNQLDWQSCNNKLAQAFLHLGQPEEAHQAIQQALRFPLPISHHFSLALYGIILARRDEIEAGQSAFEHCLQTTDELLLHSPNYVTARYSRALALSGLAVLDDTSKQATLQWQALETYQGAHALCHAPGILADAMRLLAELAPLDHNEILPSLEAVLV